MGTASCGSAISTGWSACKSCVFFSGWGRHFCLIQNGRFGCGVHPAYFRDLMVTIWPCLMLLLTFQWLPRCTVPSRMNLRVLRVWNTSFLRHSWHLTHTVSEGFKIRQFAPCTLLQVRICLWPMLIWSSNRYRTTSLRCGMSQKSTDFTYTAADAWNHAL